MKDDGEYARDKGDWVHRLAALAVVLCWVAAAWWWGGWTLAVRAGISLMLLGVMVWFPEVLCSLDVDKSGTKGYNGPCHPRVIRWVGWFFLLAGPVLFALFGRI